MDRGDPFGLLGYDFPWLKLKRVRQGASFAPILDHCSQRAVSNDLTSTESRKIHL